jgi:hypothetical protein
MIRVEAARNSRRGVLNKTNSSRLAKFKGLNFKNCSPQPGYVHRPDSEREMSHPFLVTVSFKALGWPISPLLQLPLY